MDTPDGDTPGDKPEKLDRGDEGGEGGEPSLSIVGRSRFELLSSRVSAALFWAAKTKTKKVCDDHPHSWILVNIY